MLSVLFFLFFRVCLCAAATPDAVAYFFDVGQGHCFFFKSNKHNVAVLIDAGSTKYPVPQVQDSQQQLSKAENQRRKRDKLGQIIEIIESSIDRNTRMLCILTHGDEDHYNWIKDIVDGVRHDWRNNQKTLFLLGGKEEDYFIKREVQPTFLSIINNYPRIFVADFYPQARNWSPQDIEYDLNNRVRALTIPLLSPQRSSRLVSPVVQVTQQVLPPLEIKVLHAANEASDTNEYSVAIRIKFGDHSFMITGDMPGSITQKIIAAHTRSSLLSTVLLASHHGATTEDANSIVWFNAVHPEYVIFSHGDRADFLHPHPQAIKRALANSVGTTDPHLLFYGYRSGESDKIDDIMSTSQSTKYAYTFSQLISGYHLMLTNFKVFSTYTQGDVKFSINGTTMNMSYNKHPQTVEGYLNGTELAKQVTYLWSNNWPGLAGEFLSWNVTRNEMPELTRVEMRDVNAGEAQVLDLLERLITDNPQIQELDLQENTMNISGMRALQAAWGYRGLRLPTAA